jgi:hypothetical protein
MSNVEFTERLEAALKVPMTAAQQEAVDARVASTVARHQERSRGWFRLTTRTAALLALLVFVALPTAVFAAAEYFGGSESPFGLAEPNEYDRELDAAKADTPIPAGFTWPTWLRAKNDVVYSRGGGRSQVESIAICMWQIDWLEARQSNDAARQEADRLVIAGIPTWSSYGPPFADQSYRDVLDRVISAVEHDDPAPVAANVALNCKATAAEHSR